jgi:multidrug efflux pump subunit AcrA (membrane-fusion protein)
MAGLNRNPGENALTLAHQGAGLQAVSIENVSATAKMSSWEAVKIPNKLLSMGRVTLTLLILFLLIIEFVPWTQTVTATGRLSAYTPYERPQEMEARITGRLKEWHVMEGVKVKKGDLILELEDYDPNFIAPELLALFEQRKVALQQTRQAALARADQLNKRIGQMQKLVLAAVPSADARVTEADNRVREAQQKVEAAKIDVTTAQLNVDRHRQLIKDGFVSQRELELTIQTEIGTKAMLQAAQANLQAAEQARASLSFGRDQMADISVKQESAQQRIHFARVEAPIDGTVVKMARVGIGETVKQGETLVTISPSAQDKAIEMVAEGLDSPLLTPGRKVRLVFFGIPAIPLPAWPELMAGTRGGIIKVVDQIDDGKGNYRFWVVPDPEDGQPWPEQAQVRQGTRVLGWVVLNRVPLWYELWRRFNFFPPDYKQQSPSLFDMLMPKSTGRAAGK